MIKLIIFDMDGLMFDTERLSNQCWRKIGKSYGYEIPETLLNELKGVGLAVVIEKFYKVFGKEFPFHDMHMKKVKTMHKDIKMNGIPIKKGLLSSIKWTKENNIQIAVASSSSRKSINFYLNLANLNDAFDFIVSGEQVAESKPNPEIFLKCCENFGISVENTLVLEDSHSGILAASRAGIKVAWVPDLSMITLVSKPLIYREIADLTFVPELVSTLNQER